MSMILSHNLSKKYGLMVLTIKKSKIILTLFSTFLGVNMELSLDCFVNDIVLRGVYLKK